MIKHVKIGEQIWMAKNLSVSHFRNGDIIPEVKSDEEWKRYGHEEKPAWCYYKNDPDNGRKYGKLYNWYAVSDPRGLAPVGWRVSNEEDWTSLIRFMQSANSDKILKIGESWHSKNEYKFSAFFAGVREDGELSFHFVKKSNYFLNFRYERFTRWWCGNQNNLPVAFYREVEFKGVIFRGYSNKGNGYYVRCVRGENAKTIIQKNEIKKIDLPEVKIGNQIWSSANLNVSHFKNGDDIQEIKNVEDWRLAGKEGLPAWCHMNNKEEKGMKFGKLYNWYAVNDPRGLAPEGWHIASDLEWQELVEFVGGWKFAGSKLKSIGKWAAYVEDATNDFGFSALPGGYIKDEGYHMDRSERTYSRWWTITNDNYNKAVTWDMHRARSSIGRTSYGMGGGMYVRCVKDY